MDLYAAMRAFIRVAEAHSFSGVARELRVAQSTISKQISALEAAGLFVEGIDEAHPARVVRAGVVVRAKKVAAPIREAVHLD